ncbi:hypothetical protein ACIQ4Z_15430 [Peribacillus asahii]|uniref:hypothetical protein n=1 Tax=Peribacillus asahii TaxID=228899 RepID=UPI0037FE22D7
MIKKLKPILTTAIVILVVFMAGKYLLDTLFGDMCGNEIVHTVPSPSDEKVAYIFSRDCGATTGFSPQLSILDKDDKFPNKSGNTFRTNKNFSIVWVGEKKLQVIYDKESETYEMDKRVNGIGIDYVGK